jgi:hypothetical protein
MDDFHELACLISIADCAMVSIIWRIAKNEKTKYFARKAHWE